MNIGQIEETVAFYLRKAIADFTSNGQDMLLQTLNQVRKQAERAVDFHHLKSTATLAVADENGAALSGATVANGGTINTVLMYYLQSTNPAGVVPLLHYDKRHISLKQLERDRREVWDYNTRFRPDAGERNASVASPKVYLYGESVFLDPAPTSSQTLSMDVVTWADDYTGNSDTDWFTDNHANFLIWGAIKDLNFWAGTFLDRPEGAISPRHVDRMYQEHYATMVTHNTYQIEQGRIPGI